MDMKLLKESYEFKIRSRENRIEYLEKIVEEQKETLNKEMKLFEF